MKNLFNQELALLFLLFAHNVQLKPLDVIAGKTGEEQVKEAINRAEKESDQAAKENIKSVVKAKVETEQFSPKSHEKLFAPVDLKETLDKKVEELAKLHERHKIDLEDQPKKLADKTLKSEGESILAKLATSNEVSKFTKADQELAKLAKAGEIKESMKPGEVKDVLTKEKSDETTAAVAKENAALEDESDKKMVDMATKLNNLVLKFQKKMGKLAIHPKGGTPLLPALTGITTEVKDGETNVKSIRTKPAGHAPIDLAALRNALGLAHHKATTKSDDTSKTSYKEDTKLEDRLAMEAEEEKKFSTGDSYDETGEGEDKEGDKSSQSVSSSLSPKEQASQEMQSYNALISSESNRELSQIQEEITKATQTSMGQVSVVGQKEQVNTDTPSFPGLGSLNGLGGIGDSLSGATGSSPGGGSNGGLSGSNDQYSPLQGAASEGLDPSASSSANDISSQQPSEGAINGPMNGGGEGGSPSQQQVSIDGQQPIEIGGNQEPVEMGTMGANSNPFNSGSQMNILGEGMPSQMQGQPYMGTQGNNQQQSPLELGGGQQGGEPNMAFKKSKITRRKSYLTKIKHHRKSKKEQKSNSRRSQ